MVKHPLVFWGWGFLLWIFTPSAVAQNAGSIRGVVLDQDFEAPVFEAQITLSETGEKVFTTEAGNYVFGQVPPGQYTLIFFKEGYTRQVKTGVVVTSGQLTEVNVWLTGEFAELEEFIVQDIRFGSGTEAALLELRLDSPALMDSISADLISQAGAGDAAGALQLVAGASVQDGKFAVIRGLPDRYVSSQLNSVRLPSADEDTRSVELDQFPSDVIESVQVSKSFTPDQQADASGGAVNVVLKSIPDEPILKFGLSSGFNSRIVGQNDFRTYDGGGVDLFGQDGSRDIPADGNFRGAVGTLEDNAPIDGSFDITAGGSYEFDNGLRVGGFANFFYERDSSFFENGRDDKWWVETPGGPLVPQYIQGTPSQGDFKTQLFDVTQASEEVNWGGLGIFGIEYEEQKLSVTNFFSRSAEDTSTLAEDTRGKEFFFPGHDPNDPTTPGHDNLFAAPFLRTETLQYRERTVHSLQFNGEHTLPDTGWSIGELVKFLRPEVDWTYSINSAERDEPDKRQFGSFWIPERITQFGDLVIVNPPQHRPFKPAENFTLGNVQRIWKNIEEDGDQISLNLTLPFEQWSGDEGYLKVGGFYDDVNREFNQDTFSNFNNNDLELVGEFDESFSNRFPSLPTAGSITDGPPFVDVDYEGEQQLKAGYGMIDLPLNSQLNVIGGVRYESTEIGIVNFAEQDATWIPPGSSGQVTLNPGDADVSFEQQDWLPSIGLVYSPWEELTFRTSYSKTVARQTFKELSPVQQQEFLGGDVFIGNPFLKMSSLDNFDVRIDYTPLEGSLLSATFFHKNIKDPIENVQRFAGFTFTTPLNFPKGEMNGFEFELRQELGVLWERLDGLSFGSNATFIDAEVTLPADEAAQFDLPNIQAPMSSREMTNTPEQLFNLFLTYDLKATHTRFGLFYTIRGDTLVAGAGQSNGNFIPDLFAKEFGTLTATVTQTINDNWSIRFQAKNITDPKIETVFRSEFIDRDAVRTSHRNGMEFSLSINATF